MKNLIKSATLALLLIGVASCQNTSTSGQNRVVVTQAPQQSQQVAVQTAAPDAIPGFDINQFTILLKSTTTPEALTAALNANPNNINNLDLDNNSEIDYLKVSQLDANTLQVVDETATTRVIVATLTINQNNQSYSVQGNQDYCGNNYQYQSPTGMTFGQMLFLSYMLQPHRSYYHPFWGYHRGYYGGYHPYRSHYSRPYNSGYAQQQRTSRTTTTTTTTRAVPQQQTQQRAAAPVQTKQTPNVSAPTSSQKQFNANEGNRFRSGGGSTSGFKPTPAARAPSPSTPSRSFGGSRSSGGGSRSSGGGSRSGGRR